MSSQADVYEKLGAFYLGRPFDPATGETEDEPLLYDSKDLVTHAVCVGMTGSGKTGLCVTLLEEAAIDGIPALVVDVKGDLGNMLLTFPELRGADFRPWVDAAEAAREGIGVEELAERTAELWRNGLGKWDQDGERIRRLRDAVEMTIYTPGSEAGQAVSILSSFAAPDAELRADAELLGERVATTAASVLGLLGIDADPVRSREAILLSTVLDDAWRRGEDLDLAGLIQRIQSPPVAMVGVMPVDTFFPPDKRFELAMAFNNLLASPAFRTWMSGVPLDVDRMLYTASGKPRVAIFSIAHLGDAERMFFVSLLLNQTLGWMRRRSGTASLRAILYMDEVFGYLPPVGNPPSKRPMLTLLKQARAFGLGLVLATQNPVDLDYKALSNIGTWFLGRLQTERDKMRVREGLLGATAGLSEAQLDDLLSRLDKRVFLLHNVHESAPVLFKVRWALSYLRGPLTRDQIKTLAPGGTGIDDAAPAQPARPAAVAASAVAGGSRPMLPSGIDERFLPLRARPDEDVVYRPHLVGSARVHFVDARKGVEASEDVLFLAPGEGGDWYAASPLELAAEGLEKDPVAGLRFADLPAALAQERTYKDAEKELAEMLYRTRRFDLLRSSEWDLVSTPGESERDFRIRLAERAREERDREVEKLRHKLDGQRETLAGRLRKAEERVEREAQQARDQKLQTVIGFGSTLLGAFLGRKKLSATNLNRASSVVRGISRSQKEGHDVELAQAEVGRFRAEIEALDREAQDEIAKLQERFDTAAGEVETLSLKPRKTDVDVRFLGLAWAPYRLSAGVAEPVF